MMVGGKSQEKEATEETQNLLDNVESFFYGSTVIPCIRYFYLFH